MVFQSGIQIKRIKTGFWSLRDNHNNEVGTIDTDTPGKYSVWFFTEPSSIKFDQLNEAKYYADTLWNGLQPME